MRAPIQKRSQKRVEQILDASKTLISEKGTAGLKMGDIAATAGISMASIYQYFPNKRAIVATLAKAQLDANTKKNEEILSERPASLRELSHITTRLLNQYYDMTRDDPVVNDILMGYATDKEVQSVDHADTLRNRDAIFEASKHLFLEDRHEEAKRALLLIVSLGGAAVLAAIQFDTREGRKTMDEAIRMLDAAWTTSILPLERPKSDTKG